MTAHHSSHTGPANRLVHEASPYLRQHAHNPVDWYPWGPEALAAAKANNKPIFLSIGYSACHWCHVMERESFENAEIAALMNAHFINIKVDREERPDLDQIYMNAVQLMTRHGGWPMSVFLTPALEPFYGGTYFPPRPQRGMPGFGQILERIAEVWRDDPRAVAASAGELTQTLREIAAGRHDAEALDVGTLRTAVSRLISLTDRRHGGFGGAPKFPHAMDCRVLLRGWKRFGDGDALAMARLTLDKMAAGGMYDQLGGGFHRYSTDELWLVPHFEKMLYDNALLVPAYLEAFQITGEPEYARIARETLDYVLREMTAPSGGFFSAQDADSEGEEGKFFVWTSAEIERVLGGEAARAFHVVYDVTDRGNWEGHTILNRRYSWSQAVALLNQSGSAERGNAWTSESLQSEMARCRQLLLNHRAQRVAPGRDDKILTAWNGMMLSAMSQAARVLDEPRFTEGARRCGRFVLQALRKPDGQLWHAHKDGVSYGTAFLDDFACAIDGLVDLFLATSEAEFLEGAVALAERMLADFHDREAGSFFFTPHDHEPLIARTKETHDGSTPAGSTMAAYALLRLARLTGRPDMEQAATGTLRFLSGVLQRSPTAAGQGLLAFDIDLGPTREVVLVAGDDEAEFVALRQSLARKFLPHALIVAVHSPEKRKPTPPVLTALLDGKTAITGKATVYVCERGRCLAPTHDLSQVLV